MRLLDTNIIIRFLLNDHPTQSPASKKLLETSTELILNDVTATEIIWLLSSYYKFPKTEIMGKIHELLKLNSIMANKQLLSQALYFYQKFNIDFIDAYLIAYATEENIEEIYAYDKDFDKIKSIKRLESPVRTGKLSK